MIDWPDGWTPLPEGAPNLEKELRREVSPGHPLFGRPASAVARNQDDVLYRIDGGVAEVHLTWSGTREPPPWPSTALYATLEEWRRSLA